MTEPFASSEEPNTASPLRWYEADHARLVQEVEEINKSWPNFEWYFKDGLLCCEGAVQTLEAATSLRVRLTYPAAFPITPIRVMPISPPIPKAWWGHEWHRWSDGSLCLGSPTRWELTYSGKDVLEKASEWYFNFLSKAFGKVNAMPDLGRAEISDQDLNDAIEAFRVENDVDPEENQVAEGSRDELLQRSLESSNHISEGGSI